MVTSTGLQFRCPGESHSLGPELSQQTMVGVAIAVGANAVIPLALNLQKYAHIHNKDEEGKPKKPYTRIPLWWVGIILMIGGEFFNLLAYGFAPTSLVAPVGAVGVFFNGIITTTLMKEPFTRRDGLGLVAIAAGVVGVVSSVPEVQLELTSEVIGTYILPEPRAWGYLLFIGLSVPLWMYFVVPRYEKSHVLVYLVLCSLISSVTVVSSRAFSSILTNMLATGNFAEMASFVPFGALVLIIITAIWSTAYLNKAMMLFGNNEVVPVYYTTFTLASVSSGALVYSEFLCIKYQSMLLFLLGCLCTFVGVRFVAAGHQTDGEKQPAAADPSSRFKRLMDTPVTPAAPFEVTDESATPGVGAVQRLSSLTSANVPLSESRPGPACRGLKGFVASISRKMPGGRGAMMVRSFYNSATRRVTPARVVEQRIAQGGEQECGRPCAEGASPSAPACAATVETVSAPADSAGEADCSSRQRLQDVREGHGDSSTDDSLSRPADVETTDAISHL